MDSGTGAVESGGGEEDQQEGCNGTGKEVAPVHFYVID